MEIHTAGWRSGQKVNCPPQGRHRGAGGGHVAHVACPIATARDWPLEEAGGSRPLIGCGSARARPSSAPSAPQRFSRRRTAAGTDMGFCAPLYCRA